MRSRVCAGLFLAACLASPFVARAQFQEPTKEELQMTSDPKAPGAAAVYLYREETVDDNHHFHTYYVRIKVLTDKGKDLATQSIPYEKGPFKVLGIHGRTIHPDGTVFPLTTKPSDLVDVKVQGYQRNRMVFTLPDVDVGSILEYRLEVQYDDNIVMEPDWDVQQKYFVRKAHYFYYPSTSGGVVNSRGEPMDRLMYFASDPHVAVVRDAANHYSVDATDIPAIPDEDWMPPLNSLIWRVHFYYTHATSGAEFWQAEAKHWEKDTDKFANPAKSLKDAAAGIVAAGDNDDAKSRKLYDAVQKLDNTDFGRAKSEAELKKEKIKPAKDAEGVWKQKSGSSDQLALLYVALARAAGLTAYAMEVVDRNRAVFDSSLLSMGQLDDYIAVVVVGGKEVFLDPGQKMCPYGLLAWRHTVAAGMREGPKGVALEGTPGNSYTQNTMDREAMLEVAADGSVTGSIRIVMSGQRALHWRQVAITNDDGEVKKQFNEWLKDVVPDGVQVDFDHFLALEDFNANLVGIVKVTGQLATATGKRYFLPGQFFASHSTHPFVAQDHRAIPVDVHYPEKISDDATYNLPEGFAVDSMPQADVVPWGGNAQLRVTSKSEGKSVEIQRVLEYNYTLLQAKDYSGLHDFYQQVATADQQQIVLLRAAAKAAGN
ncbi:MAG TPA: DUF3857 domain-containing protein [Terracidiphilus sp.]|nr:DUF3857 domain-containing protein [Terracidiphilus sp.]